MTDALNSRRNSSCSTSEEPFFPVDVAGVMGVKADGLPFCKWLPGAGASLVFVRRCWCSTVGARRGAAKSDPSHKNKRFRVTDGVRGRKPSAGILARHDDHLC